MRRALGARRRQAHEHQFSSAAQRQLLHLADHAGRLGRRRPSPAAGLDALPGGRGRGSAALRQQPAGAGGRGRGRGAFDAPAYAPAALQPLQLDGGAPVVDAALLEEVAGRLGPERLAMLVQAALESVCLAVAGQPPVHQLVAAVLNCLPLECRGEFSFSTELRFASRRPFRIIGLPRGRAEREWLAHHPNVTLLDLDQSCPSGAALGGWARFIERVAGRGDFDFLAAQLAQPRPALALGDLPALGLQLCDELDLSPLEQATPTSPPRGRENQGATPCGPTPPIIVSRRAPRPPPPCAPPARSPRKTSRPNRRKCWRRWKPSMTPSTTPSMATRPRLERLQALWPSALAHLGEQFLAESRVQYLRYALTVWENCVDAHGVHDPARAVQALDVLCMLFDEQP